ncbi:MAG TPA: alpha/beta hydrolase family protein [Solirubrobacteraceae bacterium]|jgi:diacylglycerol O-acyltransferase/trehalose O-mycolyltransferase|nr:alpha/beta hydrolase family protein [Solirubrobacteraceae bacterium]
MRARRVLGLLFVLAGLTAGGCGGDDGGNGAPPQRHAGGAVVVARRQVAPRLVDITVRSPALGRTAKVRLLTPPGWRPAAGGRRWPVLWLLHGCCDTYRSWSRSSDIARLPALRRVLVVMPEGGAVGFYSDWYNGGRGGPPRWETFHLAELRGLLERDYGAGSRRAIAGLSMGGLGAIAYAARHPGLFAATASYSGVVSTLRHASYITGIASLGTSDPEALWGSPTAQRRVWAAHDPVELAPKLRGTRVFVSSGNGRPGPFDRPRRADPIESALHGENVELVRRLRAAGVPATVDLYGPGTHSWPYWQRELHRSLPLLLRDLG